MDFRDYTHNMETNDFTHNISGAVITLASSDGNFYKIAGETISALRVVKMSSDNKILYASSNITTDVAFGLSLSSGLLNDSIQCLASGNRVTDSNWSWVIDKDIYLGIDGVLTQTPPTTGFIQKVAEPISNTEIIFNIKNKIILT